MDPHIIFESLRRLTEAELQTVMLQLETQASVNLQHPNTTLIAIQAFWNHTI